MGGFRRDRDPMGPIPSGAATGRRTRGASPRWFQERYDVSMWWTTWSSRSTTIPVDIQHAGGTTRVTINQQQNGGQWNSLGLFSLAGGVRYTVKITSQAGPSSTCADAVKFTNVGDVGNLPPTAVIDSISPNPALPGAVVEFTGHGADSDGGDIFAYSWRSNIDGVLSSSASFSTSALSTGQHTIYFKVQDDMGSWSTETSAHIDVTHQALNTEHIYVALMYGAPLSIYYKDLIESMGGYREGDAWKYTNLSNGKTFFIHFVTNMEDAKLALYTENATCHIGWAFQLRIGRVISEIGRYSARYHDCLLYRRQPDMELFHPDDRCQRSRPDRTARHIRTGGPNSRTGPAESCLMTSTIRAGILRIITTSPIRFREIRRITRSKRCGTALRKDFPAPVRRPGIRRTEALLPPRIPPTGDTSSRIRIPPEITAPAAPTLVPSRTTAAGRSYSAKILKST